MSRSTQQAGGVAAAADGCRNGSAAVGRLAESLRISLFAEPSVDRAADIVSLFNGEPDLATPEWICEAAAKAMREGHTHYAPFQGDIDLRDAIANLLSERHCASYDRDDIVITNGACSAIYAAIAAFVDPGEEVVLLDACWSGYEDAVRLVGGVPVRAALQSNFHLDENALAEAVSPRAKMLIVCNPCNPTGVCYSRSELETIERIAIEHNLLVLSDEVYDRIVYDEKEFVSALDLPGLASRTLLAQSFSKSYAMTGWRLGFLAAGNGMARLADRAQRTYLQSVNSISQRAGLYALGELERSAAWFDHALRVYDSRRRVGQQLLERIPRVHSRLPEATFYFWVQVDTALSSIDLSRYLHDLGRVSVHAGTEYGPAGEGYIRLSFAADESQVREGIARLEAALEVLDR